MARIRILLTTTNTWQILLIAFASSCSLLATDATTAEFDSSGTIITSAHHYRRHGGGTQQLPASTRWSRQQQLFATSSMLFPDAATKSSSSSSSSSLSVMQILRGGASSSSSYWPPIRKAPAPAAPPFGSKATTTTNNQRDQDNDNRMAAKEMMDAFLTRDSRNSFISRVYAILAGQLLFTAGVITLFGTRPQLVEWMHQPGFGAIVPILSLAISTIAWIIMSISTTARHATPIKWQILTLFTIGESISVGFISSFYKFTSVISAMMATATAASGVSIYTILQKDSKYDLSQWGSTLSSLGLIFVIYGLITLFQMIGVLPAGFLPYNDMIYGMFGATLFSFYLAYHTRLIVSGKHTKYQMNEKDYVFGAMTLYNDIINLFIYILKVIGEDRDSHRH